MKVSDEGAASRLVHFNRGSQPELQEEKALHASEQERRKQIDAACATWIISHTQGTMYWLRNWKDGELSVEGPGAEPCRAVSV
jgi:hypothetical protein